MIRKAKFLTLTFIAVAAMSTLAAPAAPAGSFDVGGQPAIITGHTEAGQEPAFVGPLTGGGSLNTKCPTASYEGTVQGLTDNTDATVTATYGPGCKINGLAAAIQMNGCKFTVTGASQPAKTALLDIIGCTSGRQIEYQQFATGCVVSIPEQSNLSHIAFSQIDAQQVTDSFTIVGVTFTFGALCPQPGHHGTNGMYLENTTVKAFVDAGTTKVTNHNHQYTEHLRGVQVNLTTT